MMDKLNNENYESVFFKLLENEYDHDERKTILDEINNNPFYAFEWECWQKTKLKDESKDFAVTYQSFFEDIKAEADLFVTPKKKRVIPFYLKISAIAACLFLAIAVTFIFITYKTDTTVISKINLPTEIKSKPQQHMAIDSVKQTKSELKTETFTIIKTKPLFKPTSDNAILVTDTVSTPIIVKQNEAPVIILSDTNLKEPKVAAVEPKPVYNRKFTVSPYQKISSEKIVKLSELEASNTNLIKFFDNKRITVVRKNKKLYLRLIEENENSILLSLK